MNQNNSQTNKQQAKKVNIIGAGLAGSEAAWQLIQRGIPVRLYEMRPKKYSPAHHTDNFGELVCSNSLRANNIENAVGLLKEELRRMDSLIMRCADENQVPAGGALAVDREKFSSQITQILTGHPLVEVIYEEVTEIPEDEITIIATGPLTDGAMAEYACPECDASVKIVYTKDVEFFRACSMLKAFIDSDEKEITQKPNDSMLCYMADMSRNAVYNIPSAKRMIRYLALMGYNSLMLYTEETYEMPEYPYFGHMRGRFTKDELREIDDYAYQFGIEVIP